MPAPSRACGGSSMLAIPLERPAQALAQIQLGAEAEHALGLCRVDEPDRNHGGLRAVVLDLGAGIAVQLEQDLQDLVHAMAAAKTDIDGLVAVEFLCGKHH